MKFENVTVTRSGKKILENVSFEPSKGRFTALIGRNGSGKSTLLGCLNGRTKYKGTITLNGKNIRDMKPEERAKTICILPQILPDTPFTVMELVSLGRRPYMGFSSRMTKEDRTHAENAVSLAGLTGLENRPVNRLSGGERQRAFLAMAIAQDAEIIVLDEATTFMDASFENETYRILKMLTGSYGKTVLSVMHNLTRAVSEADDVAILSGGVICAFDSAEAIAASNVIEKIFGVTKAVCTYDDEEKVVYI